MLGSVPVIISPKSADFVVKTDAHSGTVPDLVVVKS